MGKIIFYYIVDLVSKGIKYFSGKPKYKEAVKQILDSLSANKSFAADVSKFIDMKRGLDRGTSDSILKMPIVQTHIEKVIDKSNGELDKTELENELKNILIKSWSDLSVKAIDKVKKDIK
jgi:hypothetical protein